MCTEGLRFLRAVVVGLERVALRVERWVGILDGDIMRRNGLQILPDTSSGFGAAHTSRTLPGASTLHLVEDRIMGTIDGVSSIDICRQCVPFLIGTFLFVVLHTLIVIGLVRTGMCSQHGLLIDIVGIRPTAAGMVRRETQDIEILGGGDDGKLLDVIAEDWVRELTLYQLPGDRKGMVLFEINVTPNVGEDVVRCVRPLIDGVRFPLNGNVLVGLCGKFSNRF